MNKWSTWFEIGSWGGQWLAGFQHNNGRMIWGWGKTEDEALAKATEAYCG
jgi:hypothetical protein